MVMTIAGIGRRLEPRGLGTRRILDLLRRRGRHAGAENARSRDCRKSPQHVSAIPAGLPHRLLLPDRYQHSPSAYTSAGQRVGEKRQAFAGL